MALQLYQLWISYESYYDNGLIDERTLEYMLDGPSTVISVYPGLRRFFVPIHADATNFYPKSRVTAIVAAELEANAL